MSRHGKITERTLYPAMKEIFNEHNGQAIQEVYFGTQPDLLLDWLGSKWLVSVKIGDPSKPRALKSAVIQYMQHVVDTNIKHGMIIFFPEDIRKIKPDEQAVRLAVEQTPVYLLVMNPPMEFLGPLSVGLSKIKSTLTKQSETSFKLKTVVRLLREHVEELMDTLDINQEEILNITSDPSTFFGISHTSDRDKSVFKFLSAYIFISQILFLRLYSYEHPNILENVDLKNLSKNEVKKAFNNVLKIDYKPIFDINVIDVIPDSYVVETFRLIWGLQIEKVRYELPGRLFHQLMPPKIRKLLAAFYTRPIASELLAKLTIDKADATVLDPACGSGTILTAAYTRKKELWRKPSNPHKIFCEEQIFGIDIMPFAVHLTGANLAAMDPSTTINRVQIVVGDSLSLSPNTKLKPGYQSISDWIPGASSDTNKGIAAHTDGTEYLLRLSPVDVLLMNPPFTKMERGVRRRLRINLNRFSDQVGSEVGLWAHFIALSDMFLKEGGIVGAILPINLLRGRESKKARKIVFGKWLPLYVVKPTLNYGFSEQAEYRDIIVIARKVNRIPTNHFVKFCLVKKDLNMLHEDDLNEIVRSIKKVKSMRSATLDINSHSLSELHEHGDNLMWFIGSVSFRVRDALLSFSQRTNLCFENFPRAYFHEGYRPVPRGISKVMFITRPAPGRDQEAFLLLDHESEDALHVKTIFGIEEFSFPSRYFLPSLRTPVGVGTMDITNKHDYVAISSYPNISKIMRLVRFDRRLSRQFWSKHRRELDLIKTNVVITRRINPFSPNQKLIAFFSDTPIHPSNQVNVIQEPDKIRAKALTVILNSAIFLSKFFMSREESTGRYIDIRFYDLYEMKLYPKDEYIPRLAKIFDKFRNVEFDSISHQLDESFDDKYQEVTKILRNNPDVLIEDYYFNSLPKVKPNKDRKKFDMEVLKVLDVGTSKTELLDTYASIVYDMILTRNLSRN